ncbi:hypothetical protein [Agromyces cerinus]|uniref:Uncharacterized protein n=1 Tax=Agromyces cerinus subsp. cerinus TaxID=232089 RepID=A0A1N6F9M8_9MICO|nr:hypothetical protein [Agromyces cerinus]SIN91988.1 hypothetical protein SAMN05443544_1869 [Agromyces cerinus subsp. cerinus]
MNDKNEPGNDDWLSPAAKDVKSGVKDVLTASGEPVDQNPNIVRLSEDAGE